jgi:hypothetical protein
MVMDADLKAIAHLRAGRAILTGRIRGIPVALAADRNNAELYELGARVLHPAQWTKPRCPTCASELTIRLKHINTMVAGRAHYCPDAFHEVAS